MIRRSPSPETVSPQPALPVILYVEDEEENWVVTELRLRDRYDLRWAPDDVEACRVVRATGGLLFAVLMDIQLKGSTLDGVQLCQLFKGTLEPAAVPAHARDLPRVEAPILFVSAHGERYTDEELQRIQGQALIPKPVDYFHLTLALASINAQSAMGERPSR